MTKTCRRQVYSAAANLRRLRRPETDSKIRYGDSKVDARCGRRNRLHSTSDSMIVHVFIDF